MCVPVSRNTSRIMWTSSRRGSTSAWCFSPLIESLTSIVVPLSMARASSPCRHALGALGRLAKRAGRQHPHEVLLVFHGAAKVGGGFGGLGGELGGALDRRLVWILALQRRLGLRGLDGGQPDIREPDADLFAPAAGVERELRRHRGRGKVTDLPLELQVGASAAGRGQGDPDLGQDLVRPEAGGERSREERRD